MDTEIILKEEWLNWRNSKVTKEYLKRLFEKRENLKEGLAEGQAEGKELDRVIGQCQAYKDAIDYGLYVFEIVEDNSEENIENDS